MEAVRAAWRRELFPAGEWPRVTAGAGALTGLAVTRAEACAGLDAQLVHAPGRGRTSLPGVLAGNPIAVGYARQRAPERCATITWSCWT